VSYYYTPTTICRGYQRQMIRKPAKQKDKMNGKFVPSRSIMEKVDLLAIAESEWFALTDRKKCQSSPALLIS
jgi:hypothetical protein